MQKEEGLFSLRVLMTWLKGISAAFQVCFRRTMPCLFLLPGERASAIRTTHEAVSNNQRAHRKTGPARGIAFKGVADVAPHAANRSANIATRAQRHKQKKHAGKHSLKSPQPVTVTNSIPIPHCSFNCNHLTMSSAKKAARHVCNTFGLQAKCLGNRQFERQAQ